MPKWLLPTLSEVLAFNNSGWTATDRAPENPSFQAEPPVQRRPGRVALRQLRAEREWYGAIAALNTLLQQSFGHSACSARTIGADGKTVRCGFVLSGPSPVLSTQDLVDQISSWTLAATSIHSPHWLPLQLLPAANSTPVDGQTPPALPLLPGDPLAAEPFCLVLTPCFSLVMVLGQTQADEPAFLFSFTPEVVQQAWDAIRPRVLLMSSHQIDHLDDLVQQFPPVSPDYKTVMQFSQLMLEHLPEPLEDPRITQPRDGNLAGAAATQSNGRKARNRKQAAVNRMKPTDHPSRAAEFPSSQQEVAFGTKAKPVGATPLPEDASLDVELVQAIAHEVRTPLTTIRTLTRSLLKRTDLPPDVLRRLGIIDRECSEQIDRFGLIFRAVELETANAQQFPMSLIRTSLSEVFQQSIPRWQQQASQRHMTLDVVLPQKMPTVVSDPTMLDQALTSLIERFTRNLPAGSHIRVEMTLAGDQLKLQLQSHPDAACHGVGRDNTTASFRHSAAKSLGQMLTFQPETGSLSLNLAATKNLFQAIGGKLTVKHRPKQGEVMTVYLPLELGSSPLESSNIITI